MNSAAAATRRLDMLRLVGACAVMLALAASLGATVNLLRPKATRLPWVGDWKHHLENKAFLAGIPVTMLVGARERVEDPAVAILDARIPADYAAGHLPRALSLPVDEAERRIGAYVERLTPQTPILAYCGGGDCADGLELAIKLREFGFENVTLYAGGLTEWKAYGGAVRTGDKP